MICALFSGTSHFSSPEEKKGRGGGDLEDSGLCYHKMYLITVKALQFLISLPRSLAVNL